MSSLQSSKDLSFLISRPWLWLKPSWSHALMPSYLEFLNRFSQDQIACWRSFSWQNIQFPNPIGIAGGLDKNAEMLTALRNLGAGFIEVGTITPQPQNPNPGKIIDRSTELLSLWNKMGFPSLGAKEVKYNLKSHLPLGIPLLVNIGMNRNTPLVEAQNDYLFLIRTFHDEADAFVINISSPNTKGLRDLIQPQRLRHFLGQLLSEAKKFSDKPILIKLSPDIANNDFVDVVNLCAEMGINGFVLTNTTLSRSINSPFPSEGGVSGLELKARSRELLKLCLKSLGQNRSGKLIISVGGIMDPQEALLRLEMGADLVEVYSGLVFHGLNFLRSCQNEFLRQTHETT